jgi:hypothetical protein
LAVAILHVFVHFNFSMSQRTYSIETVLFLIVSKSYEIREPHCILLFWPICRTLYHLAPLLGTFNMSRVNVIFPHFLHEVHAHFLFESMQPIKIPLYVWSYYSLPPCLHCHSTLQEGQAGKAWERSNLVILMLNLWSFFHVFPVIFSISCCSVALPNSLRASWNWLLYNTVLIAQLSCVYYIYVRICLLEFLKYSMSSNKKWACVSSGEGLDCTRQCQSSIGIKLWKIFWFYVLVRNNCRLSTSWAVSFVETGRYYRDWYC